MAIKASGGKGNIISLSLPEAGQHLAVEASTSKVFALNFDQESVLPSRVANNLTFKAADSSITITKFFEVEKSELLPSIKLASGAILGAVDYLRNAAPAMNLAISPSVSSSFVEQSMAMESASYTGSITSTASGAFVAAKSTAPQASLSVSDGLRAAPVLDPDAFLHAAKVYETQLSSGSKPNASALTQTIKIPAGFTVDTSTGWARQPDGSYVQQGTSGKFVFNGGKLTYTLTKNAYNPDSASGTGKDAASDGIVLRLKHPDSPTPQAVYCSVDILNDAPTISIISRTSEIHCGDTMTGSFGVHFGADGPRNGQGIIVEFTVNGITTKLVNQSVGSAIRLVDSKGIEYGILTLAPEGNGRIYTFKATPNVEAALSFRVAAVDGDGDIKYANADNPISLAIVKPGGPDPSKVIGDGSNEAVDEAHLTLAAPGGLLTKEIAVPDGFVVDTTVRWSPVAGQPGIFTLQGSYGRLMYNSNSKVLTYTLTGKYAHDSGDGNNFGFDDFGSLQLVDSLKNTYSVPCKVQIIDDVPLPSMIMEGTEVASGSEVHGAWDVNFGADGKAGSNATVLQFALGDGALSSPVAFTVGAPVSVIIGGVRYGTWTLNANGSFAFKAEPNVEGKISFYIGATDADGDFVLSVDPAYVLIAKPSNPDWVIGMQEGESFDESHLGTGTNHGNAPVQHDLSLPANFTIVVEKGGWTLSNGKYILVGTAGTLTYDKGTNVLSYELNNAMSHGTAGTTSGIDDFGMVVIVDVHGNEYGAPCQIVLRDDAPEVAFSSSASSVLLGETASGAWTIGFGADGKAAASAIQLKLALWGSDAESFTIDDVQFGVPYQVIIGPDYYGTITLLANGSFSFETVAYARQARLTVSLGATDGDGDFVEQSFNLILDTPHIQAEHTIIGKEVMMDEANLPGGSLGNIAELTQVVTLPAGSRIDTSSADWVITGPGVYTLQGQYGYLTFQNNMLTYTLKNAYAHTGQGADSGFDSIYVSLLDASNIQRIVVCKIEIKDDIPVVELVADSTKIEAGDTVTGEWKVAFGADGKLTTDTPYVVKATLPNGESGTVSVPSGGTVEVIIGGNRYGFLTLNADGTFAFETEANLHDTILTVSIGAYDSEGDLGEESFVVVIDKQATGPVIPVDPIGHGTSFDEAHLANGTNPDAGALTQQFVIPKDLTVHPSVSDGWAAVAGQPGVYQIQGTHGVLEYNQNTNTLSYTLASASSLHGAAGKDSITETLGTKGTITLIDADDNTYAIQCKTTIVDDVPVLEVLGDKDLGLSGVNGFSHTGEIDIRSGADGFLNGDGSTIKVSLAWEATGTLPGSGSSSVTIPLDGSSVKIMTELGEVSLRYVNNKVQYEYLAAQGKANDTEVLKLVVVDSDNDSANDTITLTLEQDFIGGTFTLDEAGIDGIGSDQPSSSNIGDIHMIGVGSQSEIVQINWDMTSLPQSLQGNTNPDGTYSLLTWKQEGNANQPNLVAYDSAGNAVLTLVPESINGFFTGRVGATLDGALKHDVGSEQLDFTILLTLTNSSNQAIEHSIGVHIKDDIPGGGSGGAEAWVEINKAGIPPQNVVIVFDASNSISPADFKTGIEAILGLLEGYVEKGIEATFSFVSFSDYAVLFREGVSAESLINDIMATSGGNYAAMRGMPAGWTNYSAGLAVAEQIFTKADLNAQGYLSNKLFFVSDGEPNRGNLTCAEWQDFLSNTMLDIDAYAIGVGKEVYDGLKLVTNDYDNIISVKNYDELLENLLVIIDQSSDGNLLGSLQSADLTSVVSITGENNVEYTFASGEDSLTFSLGNNVQITVFRNGDYVVTNKGEMNGDLHSSLGLTVKDSDGDVYTTVLHVICKDVGVAAYDNIAPIITGEAVPKSGPYVDFTAFSGFSFTTSYYTGTYGQASASYQMPGIPNITAGSSTLNEHAITAFGKMGPLPAESKNTLNTHLGVDYHAKLSEIGIFDSPDSYVGAVTAFFTLKTTPTATIMEAGTQLVFNWAFQNGGGGNTGDAAIWVLRDATGKAVSYGLIHQGNKGEWASGVTYVDILVTGEYTLSFLNLNMGTTGATDGGLSVLVMNDVYIVAKEFAGNVISDASPDGLFDGVVAGSIISKVMVAGVSYNIDHTVTIDVKDASGNIVGVFTMTNQGSYHYRPAHGYGDVPVDVTYTLVDPTVSPAHEVSAVLHIRPDSMLFTGTDNAEVIDNSHLGLASEKTVISAGDGADTIEGGSGSEIIYGGRGNDIVHGNDGNDTIHGGMGNDRLYGDAGDDVLYGEAGNDTLYGGAGNDLLYGGAGDDYLYGGDGNDTLHGGTGVNHLTGGAEADVFVWDEKSFGGRDFIHDFSSSEDGDKLDFSDIGINSGGYIKHLDGLELDSESRELRFTLVKDMDNRENSLATMVEITFKEGDTVFDQIAAQYSLASASEKEALLEVFIASISQ